MKKIIVTVMALGLYTFLFAQQKAKPKAPVLPSSAMKTGLDSLSYALGLSLAQFYKQQGIKKVNTTLVAKAINDAMKDGKTLLNEEQMNTCITTYLQKMKSTQSAGNKKAGEAFL